MTREMTVHVMLAMVHSMIDVVGSHGNAVESAARQASPPSTAGTRRLDSTILGMPMMTVTMIVRRGDDGIRAARIARNIAAGNRSIMTTYASAMREPSGVTSACSRTNETRM